MQSKSSRKCRLAALGLLLAACLAGCKYGGVDNCADIPQGAIPAPNGGHVREWQYRQIAKAEADDFVIYLHEWYKGGSDLGPYGRYHVGLIARRLPHAIFPVVIQPSASADLDQQRRAVVITKLTNLGIRDAEARVIFDWPLPGGTYGEESERIWTDMLRDQRRDDLFNNNFGGNLFNPVGISPFGTGLGFGNTFRR